MTDPIAESPFLKDVTSAFAGLLHRGALAIKASSYDRAAFGNAAVVLGGRNVEVRLVWDRGDILADARSSSAGDWRPLERVLRAIGVAGAPEEGLLTIEQAAQIVERWLVSLENGFAPAAMSTTEKALRDLDTEAMKRAMRRWGGGDQAAD